ncbi:pilus assembly protein CpaB [Friedmanniella luteola]|uniref:Pilus assembly protein CpaB n=1 Tax=Friedmanniella luteola TaxID=546871 RepID=A0A1H1X9C3_9ACTN|nr:RcpC/CpaB family pilus assembly protein [Friedmanniella luteola]SDT05923.1 pilus assembly protein CpaB [Friedmanniella luteola]
MTALLLAVVGGLLLLVYVAKADQRAVAGLQPVRVLVLTKAVPEGATSSELAAALEERQLPGTAVAPGAVTSLSELRGRVATTSLQPGEQLLLSRLADPAALEAAKGVTVPEGLHQVSVTLEPQRVVGASLAPGATVGVFLSTKDSTRLTLQKVLVTAVQGGAVGAEGGAAPQSTPLTVTLALSGADAQKVVFTAEHGTIWLSSEPSDAPSTQTSATTEKSLYS